MIHNDELVLIDFGLATFYVDSEERHVPPATPKKQHIIGTPKYASWNIHRGEEYSRRDDLMSMVYVGLFLLYGSRFWSDIQNDNKICFLVEKSDILYPINKWYESHKIPQNIFAITKEWNELMEFARNVYRLSFQERPSYKEYIELFAKTI
jgi:serine/threonine protein kinase